MVYIQRRIKSEKEADESNLQESSDSLHSRAFFWHFIDKKYLFIKIYVFAFVWGTFKKNIGTMEMRKTLLLLTGQLAFILNMSTLTFLLNIIIGVIYVGNHLSEF